MSSRVSSTMIFSPVVRDITACGENSIVSMRSQLTTISSPLIFLTTIMPKHSQTLHRQLRSGSSDQNDGFEAFCEASLIQVLDPRDDRISIHVSGSRFGKQFRFAGVPQFELSLGSEDALLETHHRKSVLELPDLGKDFGSRSQLHQP